MINLHEEHELEPWKISTAIGGVMGGGTYG